MDLSAPAQSGSGAKMVTTSGAGRVMRGKQLATKNKISASYNCDDRIGSPRYFGQSRRKIK
jgi:hypothetical protein